MSNGASHAVGAFMAVSAGHLMLELNEGKVTAAPLVTGSLASLFGSLPDKIEPAIHPHHRQFFHGVVFATALGVTLRQIYKWDPKDPWQQLARGAGLVMGVAYLSHLFMDACTKRSIPLVGRLS